MEAEAREKAKLEEEEQTKREKLKNISGVEEESGVTLSGGPAQMAPSQQHQPQQHSIGGGEIDTTPFVAKGALTDEELEEIARKEEERMTKKTNNVVTGMSRNDHAQKQKEQQAGFGKKVTITWFDRATHDVLKKEAFYCKNQRLPMRSIMDLWGVQTVIMKDTGGRIGCVADGYSDVSFEGIDAIHVFCEK